MASQPGHQRPKARSFATVHFTISLNSASDLSLLPEGLAKSVRRLLTAGDRVAEVGYGESVFYVVLDWSGGLQLTVIRPASGGLPWIFGERATQVNLAKIGTVTLYGDISQPVLARTGWYVGSHFGFPLASCMVDPRGELNEQPIIYCQGVVLRDSQVAALQLYADVINLYETVMNGGLTPTSKN